MITHQRAMILTDTFREDVIAGLSLPQKRIASKYFYDAMGSRLFDEITQLEEYYPTRTELAIMRSHIEGMAARCGPECLLVELGAGSLIKVRLLLNALESPAAYIPVDVSGEHLEEAARELAADFPLLPVHPVVADFTKSFTLPSHPARRKIAYFPGSTIGNFDPTEATALMRRVARLVGPDGGVLLGVDLQKDVGVLDAAYNDARGVTAEFNRNLLVRINRELAANFDLNAFRHRAFYNRDHQRIEMHLVSLRSQRVHIGDHVFTFQEGETIHTENSYKFNCLELARRARGWNMRLEEAWMDPKQYFAVVYLRATSSSPRETTHESTLERRHPCRIN